jgi:hypothetical protein
MSEEISNQRRRLFGAAAVTLAAAQFGITGSARAQSSTKNASLLPVIKAGTNTSFGALKQINAGVLKCGIRRGRAGRWPGGYPSARLAL